MTDFLVDGFELFFIKIKLITDSFLIFYKKFRDDMIEFLACYAIEVLIVDLFDEFHHIFAVSKCPLEDFELQMLFFDFFDET